MKPQIIEMRDLAGRALAGGPGEPAEELTPPGLLHDARPAIRWLPGPASVDASLGG